MAEITDRRTRAVFDTKFGEPVVKRVDDNAKDATDDQIAFVAAISATLATGTDCSPMEAAGFIISVLGFHALADRAIIDNTKKLMEEHGVGYIVTYILDEIRSENESTETEQVKENADGNSNEGNTGIGG